MGDDNEPSQAVVNGQKLTPEQREAIEVFVSTLPVWRNYYVEQLPSTVFENNARYFTPIPLKKDNFPRESNWTWNRSNGSVVIDLYNQFRVKLSKYNSRQRKNSTQQQPSYKIWSYSVTVLQTKEHFAFIWCTKGKTRASRTTRPKDASKPTPVPKPTPESPVPVLEYAPQTPVPSLTRYPSSVPGLPNPSVSLPRPGTQTQSASQPPLGFIGPPFHHPNPPYCHESPYITPPTRPTGQGFSYSDYHPYSQPTGFTNSSRGYIPQRSSYPVASRATTPPVVPDGWSSYETSHHRAPYPTSRPKEFFNYKFEVPQDYSVPTPTLLPAQAQPEMSCPTPLPDDLEQWMSFVDNNDLSNFQET